MATDFNVEMFQKPWQSNGIYFPFSIVYQKNEKWHQIKPKSRFAYAKIRECQTFLK